MVKENFRKIVRIIDLSGLDMCKEIKANGQEENRHVGLVSDGRKGKV